MRRPRIRLVEPVAGPVTGSKDNWGDLLRELVEVERVYLPGGPRSVESEYDVVQAAPGVVACAIEAEREGFDAIVIDCFADPGLAAAREAVGIPVCGAGEACMLTAAGLGGKFSVVTVVRNLVPLIRTNAARLGLGERCASVRTIDVPVLSLSGTEVDSRLISESLSAVRDDGASVIVLGCTGLVGLRGAVESGLRERGVMVPVVDPTTVPTLYAFMLVSARLAHSKHYYMFPSVKGCKGR